jgi:CspA family cold shock protein
VDTKYQGTLKFLKHDSGGYGFIVPDTGGGDHFVHVRDLQASGIDPQDLVDGKSRLSYRLENDTRNGIAKAVELTVLD